MRWTQQDFGLLRHMWLEEDKTQLQIARHFGVSSAAISGVIGRLRIRKGVMKPPPPKKVKRVRKRSGPKAPRVVLPPKAPKVIVTIPPMPLATMEKVTILPQSPGVKLLRRKVGECAYLIGHHLCCGAPTTLRPGPLGPERTSWCKEHYDVVYDKTKRRRKESDRKQFKGRA